MIRTLKTPHRKLLVKNIGSLYAGEVINQVLTLVLIIFISRHLGDVGLGKYSFAFSFVALFLLLADFGLPTLITKEVARNSKLSQLHLSKTFTLKFLLNLLTLLVTLIAIAVLRKDTETIMLVILASIAMFFYNFAGVFRSIFQASELMKYEVISKIAERSVAAVFGIYLLMKGYGVFALFIVLIASNAVYYLIMHILISKKFSKVRLSIDAAYWKRAIKQSLPFWLTLIFVSIYFRIDTIMLGFMKGYAATGLYNAAYKIIEVFIKIPFLLIIAVFPAMTKLYNVSAEKTKMIYEKSYYYMLVLAVPVSAGLIIFSDKIIIAVYGSQFVDSIIALQILSISLFFAFINYLMGYLLNSIDKQKLFTLTTGISTGFNIILNLFLIPRYSYIGAGIATVISEIINFGMLYYFTHKNRFGVNIFKLCAKPLIATLMMIFILRYFSNFSIITISILGALIYFLCMLLLKGLGKEEFELVKSFITK
jgi:O-antigen/teichoic acid export membrane protein